MTDKPKDNKVKAIRSGIAIATDDNKPTPNPIVVQELKLLLEQAEKGLIQEVAYSACGEESRFGLFGEHQGFAQMAFQLRGLTLLFEESAYAHMYETLYDFEE